MTPLETTFRFARAYSPLALAVLCVAIAAAGWWSMRQEAAFLARRYYATLVVLRVAPFLLLVFLLLRPVLVYHTESSLRQHVAVLVDESESMGIADKVFSRAQLETAACLLELRKEQSQWPPKPEAVAIPSPESEKRDQGELGLREGEMGRLKQTARMELVRRALGREDGALLNRLNEQYLLNIYGFSENVREIPLERSEKASAAVDRLTTEGVSTRLGTALQRVVQDLRGQPVAGVVLISDGRNIGGIPPGSAAELAGDARMPVFAVPVGAGGSRDIAVTALIAESVVFKDDEFPVTARITSRGYQGQSVPVVFECEGAQVENRTVRLSGEEQMVTFRHKRAEEGQVKIAVRVRPQEAEETGENNSTEADVRVIDKKIKVLMVEEIPRWDYRYLLNALLRDKHVEAKVFLQQADREMAASDPVYLTAFPASEKELFEYDLLILGGLRPKYLREDQMALIEQFVSKMGGGLIFMAVENISPALLAGTPLEALLPVRVAREARPWLDPDRLEFHTAERRLGLTNEGRQHTLVTLEPERGQNEKIWQGFPGHYWAAPVGGVKPAAQVIVESVGVRDRLALPAVAVQPYGLGRVLYVGIDSTWQWRYKVGERYFVRFWTQAVQYLTLSRMLGQNKRLQIMADRDSYEAGQTVTFSIRALDASFQPRREEEIVVTVRDQTGKSHTVRGYQEPDRHGMYSAVFKIPYESHYTVSVEESGETAQLEFDAKRARVELRDPEADWQALAQVAERSGGQVVALDHLDELPRLLGESRTRFVEWREQAMWDWPPFLILFVLVKTIELALRKYWHLK